MQAFPEDATTASTAGPSAIRSQPVQSYTTNATTQLQQMVSFYRFESINDKDALRDAVFEELSRTVPGLKGTLYIAEEGVNGQFAVPVNGLETFVDVCTRHFPLMHQDDMNWGDILPMQAPTFQKFIVRTRDAILRDGLYKTTEFVQQRQKLDWNHAGEELEPADWDWELRGASSSSPWLLLDCRNDYETQLGTFQHATPLNTTTFSESWNVLQQLAVQQDSSLMMKNKDDPIYIFCTGGIRCVKVGAYMTQELGFTNVKRLKHGIVGYHKWYEGQKQCTGMARTPSLWHGENFLFDKRRFAEASTDASVE
jgi:predicted sulfurtransferase